MDFSSKYDQTRRFLRIWSHLLKKSLIENFLCRNVTDLSGTWWELSLMNALPSFFEKKKNVPLRFIVLHFITYLNPNTQLGKGFNNMTAGSLVRKFLYCRKVVIINWSR